MNKIIAAAVLALAIASLAASAHAEFKWKHPGAAPYATSREEAMKTRESAFLKLGFPTEVVARLMEATKKPGEKVKLAMGDRLTTILSKGGIVHQDVVIAWEAPIRGTELVAPAEKWQATWEGKIYTATLFDVCYNWSSIIAPAPAPKSVSTPVAVTSACPSGWSVHVNEWFLSSLQLELRKEAEALIKAAESRDSQNARNLQAYVADDVSGKLGRRFRLEVRDRAPIDGEVVANLRDPKSGVLMQNLGSFQIVAGEGDIPLTEAQYAMIVEVVFPKDFKSPTVSGGARRLWSRPEERPSTCSTHVHALKPGP